MWVLYLEFSTISKHIKIVAEIFVIPWNMSFADLWASLLIHIRFSDDIYSSTFYKYIKDIQMFLLHMSFISRVKWTIFIFHEWQGHE